jgi:hypothetical protein
MISVAHPPTHRKGAAQQNNHYLEPVESVRPVRPTESYSTWLSIYSTESNLESNIILYHQELSTLDGNVRRHYIKRQRLHQAPTITLKISDLIEDLGSHQVRSSIPQLHVSNTSSQSYKIFTIAQS